MRGEARQQGRKVERRNEARVRQAESDAMTPAQRIARLDKLGLTATKERMKLQKLLEKNS